VGVRRARGEAVLPRGLILASASPQRRAILEQAGLEFTVAPAGVEELVAGEPRAVAAENARRKALAVAGRHAPGREAPAYRGDDGSRPLVLGADTVVALDGAILGKPRDAAQAVEYVSRLAGRTHEVVGGIALARDGAVLAEAVEVTEVVFRALTAEEVEAYVALGEWEGRAGGYAIQGRGATLVRGIVGDYLNVVGLPLARLLDFRLPGNRSFLADCLRRRYGPR
jgi:septum formation protein